MPTATYTVADSSTAQIDVSFKWRVVAPTDVTAAPTSDFPSNAYPFGTGSIAANATPRQATFQLEVLPNVAVTTDRSFDVEIYDVLPAGTVLTVAKVRTKIVEDDTSSGGTGPTLVYLYGPSTVTDTGWVDAGQNYDFSSKIEDTTWTLHLRSNDNTGKGGHVLKALGNSVSMSAHPVDATTGAVANDGDGWLSNQKHDSTAVAGGLSLFVSVRGGKITVLQVNGKGVGQYLAANGALAGNFLRFRTGNFGNGTAGAAQNTSVVKA